jgi:hypothetical protein
LARSAALLGLFASRTQRNDGRASDGFGFFQLHHLTGLAMQTSRMGRLRPITGWSYTSEILVALCRLSEIVANSVMQDRR